MSSSFTVFVTNRTIEDMNSMRKWWKCEHYCSSYLGCRWMEEMERAYLCCSEASGWFSTERALCEPSPNPLRRRTRFVLLKPQTPLCLNKNAPQSQPLPPGSGPPERPQPSRCLCSHLSRGFGTGFPSHETCLHLVLSQSLCRLWSLVCPQWRPGHTPVNKQAQRTGDIHCDWFPGEQKGGRVGAAPWGPIKKQKVFKSTSGSWGEEWKDTFSLNASAEHGLNWQQTRDIFSTVERIIHVLNMNLPLS